VFAGGEALQSVQVAPQALTSLLMQAPPHECVPPVHWHELLTQCAPPVHCVPHPLQSLSLLVVSMHVPLQFICPLGHTSLQLPFWHVAPPVHWMPQPPQFGSLVVSTQEFVAAQ
jgi:hypothetical protein